MKSLGFRVQGVGFRVRIQGDLTIASYASFAPKLIVGQHDARAEVGVASRALCGDMGFRARGQGCDYRIHGEDVGN